LIFHPVSSPFERFFSFPAHKLPTYSLAISQYNLLGTLMMGSFSLTKRKERLDVDDEE